MKKRILSIILAAALLCSILPSLTLSARAETESGDCGENLTWSYDTETGALVITGSGAMKDYVGSSLFVIDLVSRIEWAPWHYCTIGVQNNGLTSVSLPEGLTSIGDRAFDCENSKYFFDSVMIPDTVTRIGIEAFYHCSCLTELTIPDSVTEIGDSAFSGCSGLTELTIPKSVTSIGAGAFSGCSSMTSISVDPDNPAYCSVGGILYNKAMTELIQCPAGKTGVLTIPESVTSIAERAFSGCAGLTEIKIPVSVTSIAERAFSGCTGLTGITIPNSVKEIKYGTFSGCSNLTKIVIPESVTNIAECAFSDCTGLTEITIPNGVKKIAAATFSGCRSLTSVIIPEGVQSIGPEAFSACKNLSNISIPDSVESIEQMAFNESAFYSDRGSWPDGILYVDNWVVDADYEVSRSVTLRTGTRGIADYAFAHCRLENMIVPDGVICIGAYAFSGCGRLKSVTIGRNVEKIGIETFDQCSSLSEITVDPANPNFCSVDNVLFSKDQTELIQCAGGKTGEYIVPSTVKKIGDYAFDSCKRLTKVTVPGSVESIGKDAFLYCEALAAVSISSGVESLGDNAFYGCKSLANVTIPDSVTSIGNWAFGHCSNLNNVTVGSGVESLGNAVFYGCSSLAQITLPDSVKSIGTGVFNGCTSLEAVSLSNQLESISDSAFCRCSSLKSITIPNRVTDIDEYAFVECESLERVTIPKSVTNIDDMAFYKCESLNEIWGYSGSAAEEYAKQHNIPFKAIDPGTGFADVGSGAYYAEPVAWAVQKGITNGTAPGKFSPDSTCTRAQVVTFLWRAKGEPEPASSANPFKDVPVGQYYTKPVLWAVENKVTSGTGATTFSPNSGCTRGQVVTFLWRAAGQPEPESSINPFTDVKSDAYYYKAVLWAVEQGITKGTSANKFSPDSTCTRGQIVTFLYRDLAE